MLNFLPFFKNASEESTLALAGVMQAADLVRQLARNGKMDTPVFQTSIGSLLKLEADSTADVYGGLAGVETGLNTLLLYLNNTQQRDMEVMRYTLGVIILEKRLSRREDLLDAIGIGVEQAIYQTEVFGSPTHANVLAKLAEIYSQTLGTFNYRIHVHGNPNYLQSTDNANKIRALLLAGVRSAMLWRQKGGGRLQFLFHRRTIVSQAEAYLHQLK
ncbi:high frequency lysogenization protein HflD [Candidatus Venteria ishoeyi]|uniref:High frequency lysogenization protein HflD homolog n=2 Tax=Candidatus Venteria ishoeyi TaxID=1899563 RepID=A0A1H6F4P0_9GAMM|nr:high frequency lysogenization protein HflD [Candidatus Venteria ishoeyi]SEH05062.1 High frequency lysogenization protein HflD [Candidatus Venteria ishoeyi]